MASTTITGRWDQNDFSSFKKLREIKPDLRGYSLFHQFFG